MARRATSSTKGRTAAREEAPAAIAEPAATKTRRNSKAKPPELQPGVESVPDSFFTGSDETAPAVAEPEASEPAKGRRGRKAKSAPAMQAVTTESKLDQEISQPVQTADIADEVEPVDIASDRSETPPDASSPASMETETPAPDSLPSAAQWDSASGTVTFDWPSIEQVASAQGPNQAMAKLLLAARAEGANSRWPF